MLTIDQIWTQSGCGLSFLEPGEYETPPNRGLRKLSDKVHAHHNSQHLFAAIESPPLVQWP
jgi:hypothetical protein